MFIFIILVPTFVWLSIREHFLFVFLIGLITFIVNTMI